MSKKVDFAIERIPGTALVWDAFTERHIIGGASYRTITVDLGRRRVMVSFKIK